MRIIVIGAILIVLWLLASGHWYVCHIKYLCDDDQVEQVLSEIPPSAITETETADTTAKPTIVFEQIDQNQAFVHFGSDKIDPCDLYVLDDFTAGLIDGMEQDSLKEIKLTGHTDSTGNSEYNYRIGLERAQSISKYFIQKGADSTRIHVFSKGETQPIADNGTPEGRAQNRRVEIKITGDNTNKDVKN